MNAFTCTISWMVLACLVVLLPMPARAVDVCGISDSLNFTGAPLPFGGETIGIGPAGGEIIGATLDVSLTARGHFNAADIGVYLVLNLQSGGASFGFTGAQVGWSGTWSTFTAHLTSNNLNGFIES